MKKNPPTPNGIAINYPAIRLWIILCAGALLFCNTLMPVDGGFGSETTNGKVSGTALLPDSSAAAGVLVMIRKSDYITNTPDDPEQSMNPTRRNVFTDSKGVFVADSMDTGSYRIEINNLSTLATLASCSILPNAKSIDIGAQTLNRYATIRGEVNLPSLNNNLHVRVYGLERFVPVDSDGTYALNNIPAGTFTLKITGQDPALQPIMLDGINAVSGSTTTAPPIGWLHSKKVILNTTASGAGVSETVCDFPVLLRLTKSVFNFTEAKRNGADVRFMKADGSTILSHEIEVWDSVNGLAAIWVLVDTLYGNTDLQMITMTWGASTGPSSDGGAVFAGDKGWSAVWHLNKSCAEASNPALSGIASGTVDTTGIIGGGKKFNDSDFIRIPGQLGTPASITLSAWAQLDSMTDMGAEVISLGDAVLLRLDDTTSGTGLLGAVHLYTTSTEFNFLNVVGGTYYKNTGWHYFAFTVDDDNRVQSIYVDGNLIKSETSKNAAIEYKGVGTDTYIGKHGFKKPFYNFIGTIDEVRVQHRAASAGWIKLCYQNQKPVDALVKF